MSGRVTTVIDVIDHALAVRRAKRELAGAADELLEGLFSGYRHASEAFQQHPMVENWATLKRAHACWSIAIRAEDTEGRST